MAAVVAMFVPAQTADAATQTIDAVVVGTLASSATAPAGSLTFFCGSSRYDAWTYSDGNGNSIGGRVSCPVNPALPVTINQRVEFQIAAGSGIYSGAGGSGSLTGLIVFNGSTLHVAVGLASFEVTT